MRSKGCRFLLLVLAFVVLAAGCGAHPQNSGGDSSGPSSTSPSASPMTDDERNIADALITILHSMMDVEYQEYPEVYSFENAVVEASYIQGYSWHDPYPDLIRVAPEGITCFVRVPSSLGHELWQYETTYYVFNLGRNADGTYHSDYYTLYTTGVESVDQYFAPGYGPSPDSFHEFEFYVPPVSSYPPSPLTQTAPAV